MAFTKIWRKFKLRLRFSKQRIKKLRKMPHMATQDHTRPYMITGGHKRPHAVIQYHNVPQKITLCPIGSLSITFWLKGTFVVPCAHSLFPGLGQHFFSTPITRKNSNKASFRTFERYSRSKTITQPPQIGLDVLAVIL